MDVNESLCMRNIFTGRNEVVAKVMFLQASVILSTGGCLPQCMLGYHTPWEQTPPGQTPPGSRHPPRADTPQADTPRADTPPQADTPGSRHPPPKKQVPAYGQWAASTHPTGMHSCFRICSWTVWMGLNEICIIVRYPCYVAKAIVSMKDENFQISHQLKIKAKYR